MRGTWPISIRHRTICQPPPDGRDMHAQPPIFLFTDFGSADIYVGQVRAVLHAQSPGSAVIDLLNDAPSFDMVASAHLLAALAARLPPGAITLAVVDPGVGSSRAPVAVQADDDGTWVPTTVSCLSSQGERRWRAVSR